MKSERRIPIALVALNLALLLLVPIAPAKAQTTQTVLSDVTVTSQPDALTVHVKTSREPRYRAAARRGGGPRGRGLGRAHAPAGRGRRAAQADPRQPVPQGHRAGRLRIES